MCISATAQQQPDAPSWAITSTDFRTERVAVRGFDNSGISVSTISTDPQLASTRVVKFDDFLQLQRLPLPRPEPAKFVALLADGGRIAGEPASTAGETIVWTNKLLGETRLPMKHLRAILRFGTQLDGASGVADDDEPRTEDVLLLTNGDAVRGILADVTNATVSIQPAGGGDASVVPIDSVLAILLATPGGTSATTANAGTTAAATDATSPSARSFRVTLSDSSAIATRLPSIRGTALVLSGLAFAGEQAQRQIPLDSVVAIEQLNGPLVWAPSLRPTENVQTPFLDVTWPARMDATLDGDPIRFADQSYAHGIGVHAYSRLSFALDRSIRSFRTRYAIDGELPYANVTVRIKLDGRVAYEQPDVTAGKLWGPIVVETHGAKTLTLEVDYGKNQDVQDRFNWIEPALLRYIPKPPATAPAPSATTLPATRPAATRATTAATLPATRP